MNRILLIGSELGKGGAERSLSYLSYFLSQHYEVTLCILSGTERKRYYPTCKNVVFIDPPQTTSLWGKLFAWRFRLRAVRRLKKEHYFDAAISFLEGPNYVNVLTRQTELVLLSVRGSKQFDAEITGLKGWLRKKILIPLLYPRADRVICASEQLADELHTYFGVPRYRLGYVYNIYEADRIQAMAAEPLTGEEAQIFSKQVIIHSGRLHQQKGQDKLLWLLALLKKDVDVRLVILGDGSLKPLLLQTAADAGLSVCDFAVDGFQPANVYLMGYQMNPFKFYARSKLFMLCSGWEGFPNVVAEALICKLPVVVADCPTGPREILNVAVNKSGPVSKVHRVAAGALMPMLNVSCAESVALWTEEVIYWLGATQPTIDVFNKLTERFSCESVVAKWKQFIAENQGVRPRIFQVITNLGPGGAQRVYHDHSESFAKHYEVEEVVFNRQEQPDIYGSLQLRHSLDVGGGGILHVKLNNLFRRSFRLAHLARCRRADLVVSHMDGANWVNVLSGTPVPKVLVVHGTVLRDDRVQGFQQWIRRHFIFRFLYNRADITVAVSDGIKAELECCGVRNVQGIPNFFDVHLLKRKAQESLSEPYATLFSSFPVLVTAGRFSRQKKHDFLIKVFCAVRKIVPGVKLVILGDGELRNHLLEVAFGEGLTCYHTWGAASFNTHFDIYFPGYVSNPFAFLSRSRLFLFPSGWEGFPMALCEAMICRVPVLSADCPTGPRQILAPGTVNLNYELKFAEATSNGMLLPMCHQEGALEVWRDAVVAALQNSTQAHLWAESAFVRVQDFDKDRVLALWFNLVNNLLYKYRVEKATAQAQAKSQYA